MERYENILGEETVFSEMNPSAKADPALYFISDAFLATNHEDRPQTSKHDRSAFDVSDAFLKLYQH